MSAKVKPVQFASTQRNENSSTCNELQLSDDNKFLNSLLVNGILSQETNADSSDLDQSVNLNSNDSAHSSHDNDQVPYASDRSSRSFDKFHTEKSQSTSDNVTCNQASRLDIQSAINVQTLTQLDNLSKRLEKNRRKKYKKTLDRSKIKKSPKTVDTVAETSRSKRKTRYNLRIHKAGCCFTSEIRQESARTNGVSQNRYSFKIKVTKRWQGRSTG